MNFIFSTEKIAILTDNGPKNTNCNRTVQCDKQQMREDGADYDDGVFYDPAASTSHTIDDENLPEQTNDTAQESNLNAFNCGSEYMDRLAYDSSSGSEAMTDWNGLDDEKKGDQKTDENIELLTNIAETVTKLNDNVECGVSLLSTPACEPNLPRLRSIKRRPQFKIESLIGRQNPRMLNASIAPSSKHKRAEKVATNTAETYKKIRKNVYSHGVKPVKSYYLDQCGCKLDELCGDNCFNRSVLIECDAKCRCGNKCKNKSIQNNAIAPIERFKTEKKGWGIRACQTIKEGTFIIEYIGEIVNSSTFQERMETIYKHDVHHFGLKMDRDQLIDSHRMGNLSRFINNSCDPNCKMQRWEVAGYSRMALFAIKDIKKGEEITFNYNFSPFKNAQKCKCGTDECSGYIAAKTKVRRRMASKPSKSLAMAIQDNIVNANIHDFGAANKMMNFERNIGTGSRFEAPTIAGKLNICSNIFRFKRRDIFKIQFRCV